MRVERRALLGADRRHAGRATSLGGHSKSDGRDNAAELAGIADRTDCRLAVAESTFRSEARRVRGSASADARTSARGQVRATARTWSTAAAGNECAASSSPRMMPPPASPSSWRARVESPAHRCGSFVVSRADAHLRKAAGTSRRASTVGPCHPATPTSRHRVSSKAISMAGPSNHSSGQRQYKCWSCEGARRTPQTRPGRYAARATAVRHAARLACLRPLSQLATNMP